MDIDGIPIAWVPRTSLLELLLTAEPSSKRSALLVEHRDEILEDCHSWVDELDDELVSSIASNSEGMTRQREALQRPLLAAAMAATRSNATGIDVQGQYVRRNATEA